jgi:hypothetical protein
MLVALVIPHPQAHPKVATAALVMVLVVVVLAVVAAVLVQRVLPHHFQMAVMEVLEQLHLLRGHQ